MPTFYAICADVFEQRNYKEEFDLLRFENGFARRANC